MAPLTTAFTNPRRPQIKEEGWWLVAGDAASGELFAIKRVSFGQRATAR